MTSKAIYDLIALEPLFSQLPRSPMGRPNRNADVLVTRDQAKTILAAITHLQSLPVADGRKEGLEPMPESVIDLMIDTIRTWMTADGELRSREGLSTTPDTHMMQIPCNFWPTHGMFAKWIETLEAQRVFIASPHEVVPSGWVMPGGGSLTIGNDQRAESAAPSAPAVKEDEARNLIRKGIDRSVAKMTSVGPGYSMTVHFVDLDALNTFESGIQIIVNEARAALAAIEKPAMTQGEG